MMLEVPQQSKDRNVIKIAVTAQAKAEIERVATEYDMKEFAVASRIYEWFAGQDDIFQRAVLGMLKGLEVDAARAFMERMAEGVQPGPMTGKGAVIPPNPQRGSGRGQQAGETSKRN